MKKLICSVILAIGLLCSISAEVLLQIDCNWPFATIEMGSSFSTEWGGSFIPQGENIRVLGKVYDSNNWKLYAGGGLGYYNMPCVGIEGAASYTMKEFDTASLELMTQVDFNVGIMGFETVGALLYPGVFTGVFFFSKENGWYVGAGPRMNFIISMNPGSDSVLGVPAVSLVAGYRFK